MGCIRINNIGKAYKRYSKKSGRFLEWLGLGKHHELVWVLRDITFEVQPGEALGIVGVNGAGKSTLLKIIAGTVKPTTGAVEVGGRVSALLELGMGFHPDFTGRENVYMAAQLKGMTREEVNERMREIEEFAEIGEYIDQPVRVYSSGMQVRLAFSVATCVRPDILIVDEALSVGDIFFQQKCFDRIRAFMEAGTTLLFVSHSTGVVYSLCSRAILMEAGRILIDDKPKPVIDLYNAKLVRRTSDPSGALTIIGQDQGAQKTDVFHRVNNNDETAGDILKKIVVDADLLVQPRQKMCYPGSYFTKGVRIESIKLLVDGVPVESFVSESELTIRIRVVFDKDYSDPHVGFQIRDVRGEAVFVTNTHCMRKSIGPVCSGSALDVVFSFKAALAEGQYTLTIGVANGGLFEGQFRQSLVRLQNALTFSVLRNHDSILWGGICNLNPVCEVLKDIPIE